jgi:hypothetical protein
VIAQERGNRGAGGVTVERAERVPDVGLVGEESVGGGADVGQVAGLGRGAHDEQARPRDVVLPQLAHPVVEGLTGGGRAVERRARVGGGGVRRVRGRRTAGEDGDDETERGADGAEGNGEAREEAHPWGPFEVARAGWAEARSGW